MKIEILELEYLPPYNSEILRNLDLLKILTQDFALSMCKLLLQYKQLYSSKKLRLRAKPFYGAHVLLDSLLLLIKDFLVANPEQKINHQKIDICRKSFDLVFLNYEYLRSHTKTEIISNVNTAIARIFYCTVEDLVKQT